MARKRRRFDASDDDSQDSDYEAVPRKKKQSKAAIAKAQRPKLKAEIIIRATDISTDEAGVRDRLSKVDSAVLDRIKKALALGNHENTSEQEARAAIRMATRLLDKHNVTQADLLSQETDEEKLKRAGTSVVSIRRTDEKDEDEDEEPKRVNVEHWCSVLAYAMTTFFDCQEYNTAFEYRVDWSFYGLAEQTVTAALAFEMTYNLVLAWSLKPSLGLKPSGRHEKNCYRIGVAEGLATMAKNEKKHEKGQAHHREQALLQARRDAEKADELTRIARLAGPVKIEADVSDSNASLKDIRVKMEEVEDEDVKRNFARNPPKQETSLFDDIPHTRTANTILDSPGDRSFDEMSDDDDNSGDVENSNQLDFLPPDFHGYDDVDDLLDLDATDPDSTKNQSSSISGPSTELMGPPSSTVPIAEQKAKKESENDSSHWNSVGQLVAFREASVAIGDDYLKSQGIKLTTARKNTFAIKSKARSQLYRKGSGDAKRINVRRKLLKDAEDD